MEEITNLHISFGGNSNDVVDYLMVNNRVRFSCA